LSEERRARLRERLSAWAATGLFRYLVVPTAALIVVGLVTLPILTRLLHVQAKDVVSAYVGALMGAVVAVLAGVTGAQRMHEDELARDRDARTSRCRAVIEVTEHEMTELIVVIAKSVGLFVDTQPGRPLVSETEMERRLELYHHHNMDLQLTLPAACWIKLEQLESRIRHALHCCNAYPSANVKAATDPHYLRAALYDIVGSPVEDVPNDDLAAVIDDRLRQLACYIANELIAVFTVIRLVASRLEDPAALIGLQFNSISNLKEYRVHISPHDWVPQESALASGTRGALAALWLPRTDKNKAEDFCREVNQLLVSAVGPGPQSPGQLETSRR
jgi:hypothetical protein